MFCNKEKIWWNEEISGNIDKFHSFSVYHYYNLEVNLKFDFFFNS